MVALPTLGSGHDVLFPLFIGLVAGEPWYAIEAAVIHRPKKLFSSVAVTRPRPKD